MSRRSTARRDFLKFLAASPYVASVGGIAALLHQGPLAQGMHQTPGIITSPAEALNVFDFEEPAHRKVDPGHWAYMVSGVDDDGTLQANLDGFKHIELRPRRLRDATKVDMRVDIFGTTYNSPIFLCPTSGERSFHPDGEVAVARAAKARGTLQFLSTATSIAVEEVNAALGRPVWYQMYAPSPWDACEKMLQRVEAAGCNVICLTVDQMGRNMETYFRTRPKNLLQCAPCHEVSGTAVLARYHPMHDGIGMTGVLKALDWAYVDQIRKFWKGKFIIKGMETPEDARLCIEHGIDGILVSNHGARSIETLRGTIDELPDVIAEVNGRIPVFVDGGVRRGTDVFKALAMGAKAVGIGRPLLWGLGSFGQAGVDRVLEILQGELKLVMGNCGTQTVADITRSYIATPERKS